MRLSATTAAIVLGAIGCTHPVEEFREVAATDARVDTAVPADVSVDAPGVEVSPDAAPLDAVGEALPECSSPRKMCGALCIDPRSDDRHCGECDNACMSGESCKSSKCK